MTDNPNRPVKMPSAQESLDKIGDTLGARENNYNNPKDNFDDIAAVWTQLLITEGVIPRDGKRLSALSVARLMVGMKLVRDAFKVKLDNWVDTAGYGVCGLRIAEYLELVEAAEKLLATESPKVIVGIYAVNNIDYEIAVTEFYKTHNIDLSQPMSREQIEQLKTYLMQKGLWPDG